MAVDTQRKRPPAYDRKRIQLLAAAARVFCEVGYDRASMRRIATEAESSLAGLYHYIDGKEELLFSIQLHTFDSLLRGLADSLAGLANPRARLAAAVRNHVRHFGENMAELKVCAREIETLEGEAFDEVRELRRAYFEAIHDLVRELQPDRDETVGSWYATANLFGMLNWLYQWYDADRTRVSLDDLAAQQTALFLNGYVASASSTVQGGHA
jgi:AcrR family transcriptional regulator